MCGGVLSCRPLKFDVAEGEAYLLVTAEVDPASRSCISVALQPQDETPGTTSVLEGDAVEVVKVAIEQIEVHCVSFCLFLLTRSTGPGLL